MFASSLEVAIEGQYDALPEITEEHPFTTPNRIGGSLDAEVRQELLFLDSPVPA